PTPSTLLPYATLFRSEHRQAQERSRDLDERQPFGVLFGNGHDYCSVWALPVRSIASRSIFMSSRSARLVRNHSKAFKASVSSSSDRKSTRLNSSHVKI